MKSSRVPLAERSTRRTATVTISQPEASWHSRISSFELYLPVPRISLDPKARPAMVRGASCGRESATTDEGHDFHAVAFADRRFLVVSLSHQASVQLDRDRPAHEAQRFEGATHRSRGGQGPRFTVQIHPNDRLGS